MSRATPRASVREARVRRRAGVAIAWKRTRVPAIRGRSRLIHLRARPNRWTDGGAQSLTQVVREFAYDDTGRMRQVRHDGIVAMDYLYNGKGERVYRSGGGQSITTLYDDDGKWIGDYDGNGQPIQQVIWMDDLPVGLLVGAGANQKLYYIEADALGTPRVVTDPARNLAVWTWSLEGEAFGDSAPNQDADGDGIPFVFDMRFPGQRYDSATGMSYNYFRDYEASTGRYVESDPIGLAGGMSTYSYASNSPSNTIDPYGLDGIRVDYQEMYENGRRDAVRLRAASILFDHWVALGNKNVPRADQFYHCLASCKATQATGDPNVVLELLASKESFDSFRNSTIGYAGKKRSAEEMRIDMEKDMKVNRYGAACKSGENCVKRCRHYLDIVDKKYRKYLVEFRPEWRGVK